MRNIGLRLTLCMVSAVRFSTETVMIDTDKSKTKTKRKKKSGAKRQRLRALPSRDAIAFTISDYQALGGPGRTSIYNLAKAGKLKTFVDRFGRRMIDGDSGREMLTSEDA
jgi:hypothetical protein